MPEFTKKINKFAYKGMQFNRPVDDIPEGQVCYARNIRTDQLGAITQRPGLNNYANLGGFYVHSLANLNNFTTDFVGFSSVDIVAQDQSLYVADTSAHLTNASINPIPIGPASNKFSLSGNPLTMVDMAPVGTNLGWKYVGDANENFSVGYYPGDTDTPGSGNNSGIARALTMGMTPPVNVTIPVATASGNLTGSYQWIFAYRNMFTGARSNPSAPTRVSIATPALAVTNKAPDMVLPTTPIDPLTGSADANILVDIYRFGGTINDWRYVGTGASGTTFRDNLPDSSIITASTPPEVTDPNTGVTRFNLFRPFVTQDNARYSTSNGAVTSQANGTWILTAGGGDVFDLNWLPGSVIGIAGGIYNVFQIISATVMEITQDLSTDFTTGDSVVWATATGILKAGTPLPHIWGPFGLGSGGAYIFGCGCTPGSPSGKADAGTLYWTNGNDPDSTDLPNSLVVTNPSEPLRGGCVYDGTPICWSTERMFRIYPSGVAGQFAVQEVPGGKGIFAEYSLTVQSNGIADQSVTWVGKDGIYDWSTSQGLQSLTDRDLYPFFPHDNQDGQALASIFPFINALLSSQVLPTNAPNFDPSLIRYHRLCWFEGNLFYDHPTGTGWNTLVYDSKNAQGWVSLDQYSNGPGTPGSSPLARGIQIAKNNMRVGIGGAVDDYLGTTDNGHTITPQLITRADDLQDPRGQKLFGDYWVDLAPGSAINLISQVWFDNFTSAGPTHTYTGGLRQQIIIDTSGSGLGVLARSFGLNFLWNAGPVNVILFQYTFDYVPKPEFTLLRATDRTDDGYNGAKYLRGLCIEANTNGLAKDINVMVDGTFVGTVQVQTNGQLEVPFAVSPFAGSEFYLEPSPLNNVPWELFQVRWVWEKWPDLDLIQSSWMNMGSPRAKYVRGFSIPISASNVLPIGFTAEYDGVGTNPIALAPVAPVSLTTKSTANYYFLPPVVAHVMKLTPSNPVRAFYDEIVWDAEEWPELEVLYGPIENLGTSGVKYLRGFEIPIETNGSPAAMQLFYDSQPTDTSGVTLSITFPPVNTNILSKNVFPFTIKPPIIAHNVQLRSVDKARFFYQEIKWDFEPWPEFSDGFSHWFDAGSPEAKFLQGCVIPMDTGGANASLTLRSDFGITVMGPFNTIAGAKTPVPWSFPVPFIAHEMQIIKATDIRVWTDEIKWVWEPVPELVTTYTTQATDHDLPGWHYLFDGYIAYIGSADAPVLSITTEYGTITYTLPVSNGAYTRAYVLFQPQKAKWRSYSITSTGGMRLFLKDCEVRVKAWTDKGNYPASFQSDHPFGDLSRTAGARI